jgi:hypothetical protein
MNPESDTAQDWISNMISSSGPAIETNNHRGEDGRKHNHKHRISNRRTECDHGRAN